MSKHIFLYYYKVLIMGATWQSLTSETIDQMNNLGGGLFTRQNLQLRICSARDGICHDWKGYLCWSCQQHSLHFPLFMITS